jgi:RND family efflux transporter MFP subunit
VLAPSNVPVFAEPRSAAPMMYSTAAAWLLFGLVLGLMWLPGKAGADALPVNATTLLEQQHYTVNRHYAGMLNPLRTSQLGFESSGVVTLINVREGDRVAAGDALIALDMAAGWADLMVAQANVANARASLLAQQAQLELAQSNLRRDADIVARGLGAAQRTEELAIQGRVAEARLSMLETALQSATAQLELAQVRFRKLQINAPFAGIIQSRGVDEGTIVSPGQTVLTIVEDAGVEARIGLPESAMNYLQVGQSYQFRVAERQVSGVLKAVLPVADQVTGTITALFELQDKSLFAGVVAELLLTADVQAAGYWLPLSALAESQRGLWAVLVVKGEGEVSVVESRLVEVIHRGDDAVYVRGTLREGELVIVDGTARIVPGQGVRVTRSENPVAAANE